MPVREGPSALLCGQTSRDTGEIGPQHPYILYVCCTLPAAQYFNQPVLHPGGCGCGGGFNSETVACIVGRIESHCLERLTDLPDQGVSSQRLAAIVVEKRARGCTPHGYRAGKRCYGTKFQAGLPKAHGYPLPERVGLRRFDAHQDSRGRSLGVDRDISDGKMNVRIIGCHSWNGGLPGPEEAEETCAGGSPEHARLKIYALRLPGALESSLNPPLSGAGFVGFWILTAPEFTLCLGEHIVASPCR